MKKIYGLLTLGILFIAYGCSKDDDGSKPVSTDYKIVNIGNGGVNTIDSSITEPLTVVQAIPAVENTDYPKSIPIILFFNSKIYLNSLEGNIEVTQSGEKVGGTITINEGANGFAIMTFTPNKSFDAGTTINFSLGDVQNNGGNGFPMGGYSLTYETNNQSSGNFDGNGGFENQEQGVLFLGDGAVMQGTQGCVSPTEGNHFAAITTGNQLISNGSAIGGASSMMVLGAIDKNLSSFSFSYNFLSSEFNEYVGSQFDDSVIITIVGSNGAHSEFLTSVNTVEHDNTQCHGFPGLPDGGDDYAGETGWINKTLTFPGVGSPAYVIFTISDVGDTILSSVLTVDGITY